MDVRLEFLNAAHGDAILVSWGEPPRLAIIDGGPTGSFEVALGPRLAQLRTQRAIVDGDPLRIDLLCVSHIDDDHIAGVVRLLAGVRRRQRDGLPPEYELDRLWTNTFEDLVVAGSTAASPGDVERGVRRLARASSAIAASVRQGRDVRDLGRALGLTGNAPFGGPVVGGLGTDLFGLQFTIVSPDTGALDGLAKTWQAATRSNDPAVLAAAFTDRSVPNLSSICSVLGGPNGRALLTADARGDRVLAGLEAIGLLPVGGMVHFDVFQVPHHGSANNSDEELFQRVHADHYVISADGIKHQHPDPAVLDWIVGARGSDAYAIHLTNPIPRALTKLRGLASGRNFSVDARADQALGVSVDFQA